MNDDAVSGAAVAVAPSILKASGVHPGDRVVQLDVFFDGIARRSGIHVRVAGDKDAGRVVNDHQLTFKGRPFQIDDLNLIQIRAFRRSRFLARIAQLRIADCVQFCLGIEQLRGFVLQTAFLHRFQQMLRIRFVRPAIDRIERQRTGNPGAGQNHHQDDAAQRSGRKAPRRQRPAAKTAGRRSHNA